MTRWAKAVRPNKVHREYPRPQMVRKEWLNLNGLWGYAISAKDEQQPDTFDGQILVPFPVESALSGVMKAVGKEKCLWYKRTFKISEKWKGQRILLHFEAVDWETTVLVNGVTAGTHRGGYDGFSFDITDFLKQNGPQELVVSVWDPTDRGMQSRGKQVTNPGSIWYTPTTGIWQTVWLEPVPKAHIEALKMITDIDAELVRIGIGCVNAGEGFKIEAEARDGWFTKDKALSDTGQDVVLKIKNAKLWSPEKPFLYDLEVRLKDGEGKIVDTVKSYFGMRKISIGKDKNGVVRIFLNNKPQFMFGPLDQGFWPDGLYTAPTDEALRYDIEVTKRIGFNMARKHVKIEPERWYYWCDKLGLLVWQDMPNGDRHVDGKDPDIVRSGDSAKQFEYELKRLVESRYNHPSIVMWVIFNEGWGQYDTVRLTNLVKEWDGTRLVNSASGWKDHGVGDVHDIHKYPGPAAPPNESSRAAVLGEFGGLGLPLAGHTWQDEKNWGYRNLKTRKELTENYRQLLEKLEPMVEKGLSAAVYTQTTDVEIEVNGLMSYDREVIKMDVNKLAKVNKKIISSYEHLN